MSTTTVTTTGAGLEGVVAGESEICYIDGYAGVLSYRGYNIHTLAEHATFEEVIWLLWKGTLPKQNELAQLKSDLLANAALPPQVADFLKAIAEGKEAAPTFRDGLATDYVTDAVLQSAKSRQWEKVAG